MKSLWDERARAGILRRIERLRPESTPLWGRMSAPEMLAHLVQGMRLGRGEFPVKVHRTPFRFWPLKYLYVYWLPLPKEVPAPRELVTRGSAPNWDATMLELRQFIEEFVKRDRNSDWGSHPYFGRLSPKAWGALGWRHLDHHLRQFGV